LGNTHPPRALNPKARRQKVARDIERSGRDQALRDETRQDFVD
jgi:hypothetical protein